VEWFGAVGDGITDDYQALYNCFNHHYNPEGGTTDPNSLQHTIPALTFYLPHGCYRYTQPLRLPCRGTVTCEGILNYFARPEVATQKNRSTLFYDGTNLEVAACYLPVFKRVNNAWQLITDSTEFFTFSSGISNHSMCRGSSFRFNLITKQKTKIGVNAFGLESGRLELGIGTLGTLASIQNQSSWSDYNEDDLSPKIGILFTIAWNIELYKCRILAHNQGVYIGGSTGSTVINGCYINRQVSTAASAVTDGMLYYPSIMETKKNLTSAITVEGGDVSIYDTVTEGWGCPYVLASGTRATIQAPHIEGPNDIMMHCFMIYNAKVQVHDWSAIRTMQLRSGTSVVYSFGMTNERGYIFELDGAGYYADNSLFNLVDGVAYDQYTNYGFLKLKNIATFKVTGGTFSSDLRLIQSIELAQSNTYRTPIYLDPARTGLKGLGLGSATACQSFDDVIEAIRILGLLWDGSIILTSNLTISTSYTLSLLNNIHNIVFTIQPNVTLTISNRFKVSCSNITFNGGGNVVVNSPLVEPIDLKHSSDVSVRLSNITIAGISAFVRGDSVFGTTNLCIESNVNLSEWTGKYLYSPNGYGLFNIMVLTTSRNSTVKNNEISNNNVDARNFIVVSKIFVA